jgi:PAS domain S-box-containing protein
MLNPLRLLGVFWLSLHGTRRDVQVGLVVLAATLVLPIFAIGGSQYPPQEALRALVWTTLATVACLVVQGIVEGSWRDAVQAEVVANERSSLAAIVENSADAIVGMSPSGAITTWNAGAERLYGYSAEEMVGTDSRRIVPTMSADEATDLLGATISGQRVLQDFEMVVRAKDGHDVPVSVTVSPIHDGSGSAVGLATIARDISERRRAEDATARANEELRNADQLKGQFVAMVSHELRTPLTSILGFAATLRSRFDELDADDAQQFLGIIEEQAERLSRLVADVLVISRIESGALATRPLEVDVAAAVREVLLQLDLAHEVEVVCEPARRVWADEDHLQQILTNYLANACRYGAPPIRVEVAPSGATVRIAVVDSGAGVAPEFAPQLFEQFTQAPGSSAGGGTGLGLSIVQGLAHANSGEAWYEPDAQGGSRFVVSLPAAR